MNADPRTPRPRGQVLDRELLAALRELRRSFGADQVSLPPMSAARPLRLLVCGSRSWTDRLLLGAVLDRVALQHSAGHDGVTLLHGGARGADRLAGQLAEQRGWRVEIYPADWDRHGRAAGILRNALMLSRGHPDRVVAFAEDLASSRGTADMVGRARAGRLPVEVVEPLRYRGLSLTGPVDELRHAVNRLRADTIGTLHDPRTPAPDLPAHPVPAGRLWDEQHPRERER